MSTEEDLNDGITPEQLKGDAKRVKAWAKRGDTFVYYIAGAKVRNPAAAQALIKELAPKKAGKAKA